MTLYLITVLTALRVAFVGDPQVDNPQELKYARQSLYSELRARTDLDLVVILGDLVNENPSLIAPSEATLDSLRCPWVRVQGNHDGPVSCGDTTLLYPGLRFILLDNVRRSRRSGYEAGLNNAQKHWLDSLVKASRDCRIVVCTHIPMSESRSLDSLSNILAPSRDVLLVSGHTHSVDRHILERGMEEVIAGASCGMWWRGVKGEDGIPNALMNCGSPRGYFIADFRPRKERWYTLDYKCVGRPESDRASARLKDGALTINVYGGSREGVLEVREGHRWVEAAHRYVPAPEALDIVEWNKRVMTKEYKKAHREEFIPMRSLPSPHVWVLDNYDNKTGSVDIRYRDGAFTFRTTLSL